MPELPEIEAVRLAIGPRIVGLTITEMAINPRKGYMLRYPASALRAEMAGGAIRRVWRRGKHLVLDVELHQGPGSRQLVINPMLSGRVQLASADSRRPSAYVFAAVLENGGELRYLDTRDMGRVYWVSDPEREVPGWADLGPEATSAQEEGLEWFRKRLRRYRGALKDILRNQAFLAGVGNAYSDEILFEARVLPLRRRSSLQAEEEEALFQAIGTVLNTAIETIRANPDYDESKQDRSFMAVHGKGGAMCPRCGHRISQVGSDREPMNFCRGCQR